MKKKLFCLCLCCFFSGSVLAEQIHSPRNADLPDAVREKMAEVHKHNEQQLKNRVSLEQYHKDHSGKRAEKSEAYWDLAWHAKLADYGDPESQFEIAKGYEAGDVIEQDLKKALVFYQKAGDNGHVAACLRLAEIYRENKWVQADPEKEIYWYEKAARQGHIQAQIKVSDLYQSGDNPDYLKSYEWLKIALHGLFPDDSDVEKHSPELQRLKALIPTDDVVKEKTDE